MAKTCTDCDGEGEIEETCGQCDGTGVYGELCDTCDGTGEVDVDDESDNEKETV